MKFLAAALAAFSLALAPAGAWAAKPPTAGAAKHKVDKKAKKAHKTAKKAHKKVA